MKSTDFRVFFRELHGQDPFPWQERLAQAVCETHEWPEVLDLPTGSGKTACIDVALFNWLVAAGADNSSSAARRIAFVVDRRIIVDEASERAARISRTIAAATSGLLGEARGVLEGRAGSERIAVITLRGGVERERNLVDDPRALAVVLSTVDQIGSRLLFRGYGVSDRMKPMHAGLFGVDTLLLLDEAHIAEPFRQTLEGIVREQRRAQVRDVGPRPLRWAQLSATPSDDQAQGVFRLDERDHAHVVLGERIRKSKPMRLVSVGKQDDLVKKLVELVKEELDKPGLSSQEQPRIGIFVNRVQTARAVFDNLAKAHGATADVELLIGRVRPIERDSQMAELAPRLRSSVSPRPGDRPIIVVATQTLEVGADFDFHAVFSEAASYAALKQRVGRLNRLAVRATSRGAIVRVADGKAVDPVYGETIASTWELLRSHAKDEVVDLGIVHAPPASAEVRVRAPRAPLLTPAALGLLAQTSPRPAVQPDVAELLHGFDTQVPDVSVVWRDGLLGIDGEVDERSAQELLRVLPPSSLEAMSVPFVAFRMWAASFGASRKSKFDDGGDLEGGAVPTAEEMRERIDVPVLVVDGRRVRRQRASAVRPGALVVISTDRGGIDEFGWKPESNTRVDDLALRARDRGLADAADDPGKRSARERTFVWTASLIRDWERRAKDAGIDGPPLDVAPLEALLADPNADRRDAKHAFIEWFAANGERLPADVGRTAKLLCDRKSSRAEWLMGTERIGVALRWGLPTAEDLIEGALQRTVRVELAEHSAGVAHWAQTFARGVGLSDRMVETLRVAGSTHDLGKADPRFQRRLCAREGEVLAKSDEDDRTAPRGQRHEVYSVAVLDAHEHLCASVPEHRALVRHLVGTHHGFGRALQPVRDDHGASFTMLHEGSVLTYKGCPDVAAAGSHWSDMFGQLQCTYGPWMLAYLEALLRLADFRRSAEEVENAKEAT